MDNDGGLQWYQTVGQFEEQQMSEKKTGLALMREPFPPHQISKMCRSTKKDNPKGKCPKCNGWHGLPAIQLDYVGHAALTDRLLESDPQWAWEPISMGPNGGPVLDESGGMWIRLTVCGVTRLGYGDAQGKQGGDAMKERIGDALRNAAMRFGAALELWHKGDLHLDEEPEQVKAGITDQQFEKFQTSITKAKTTKALTDIWKTIAQACREAKDNATYNNLKNEVSHKGAALKAAEAELENTPTGQDGDHNE